MVAVGQIARGKDFFDREEERKKLWRYLEDGEHVVIFGPRRLGKSSLLEKMVEEASEPGRSLPAGKRIDVGGYSTVPEMLAMIEKAFPEKWFKDLAEKYPKLAQVIERVKAWFHEISVKLPNTEDQREAGSRWLQDAEAIKERLSELPILIALDEFTVFLEKLLRRNRDEGEKFLGWLRAWRQQGPACRFIFSGSIGIRSLLARYQLSSKFNDCVEFDLSPFSSSVALEMLDQHSQRYHLPPDDGVLEYLCQRIGWLSPYYLNLLWLEAKQVAEERIDAESPKIQQLLRDDVENAYQNLIKGNSSLNDWYEHLGKQYAEPELAMVKLILKYVARAKDDMTHAKLANRLSKLENDPDVVRSLLNELHEDGYLTREDPIRFLSFLLRDYWRMNHAG